MLHISDPKFQVVVKKTGSSIGTVAAVWLFFNCNQSAKKRDLMCELELQACDNFFSLIDGTSKAILDLLLELEILEVKKKRAGADSERMAKLPAGFYPNETGVIKAEELGVNVAIELTRFTDYHKSKASKMADWQAAWRTWVGNASKFKGQSSQLNRQVAVEERNKAAGLEWLRQQGA